MEAFDLALKMAYAGEHSPVPFITGPIYLNSVPAVPVCAQLRIFIAQEQWSDENVKIVAKEVCRVLGPTSIFDIGMALAGKRVYDANVSARGDTARLMKLDADDPHVTMHVEGRLGDQAFRARFPRLQFEPIEEDFWRSIYAPGAVKQPQQL
ncbi:MAG TPA: hypothetical protein VF221_08905 [Chloroflexota bacterium]